MAAIGRLTKLLVAGWALAAVAAEAWFLRGWHLTSITAFALLGAAALSLIDRRAIAAVLACAYLFPVVLASRYGHYEAQFAAVWMAAVLGAILPDLLGEPWHIPDPWRAPLVCWALTIVAGA